MVQTLALILNLAKPIVKTGIDILTFDFSGDCESTGELKKSSLSKRVNEANEIIKQFASNKSLTICGASMGDLLQ